MSESVRERQRGALRALLASTLIWTAASAGTDPDPAPLESGYREEATTRLHLLDVVVVDRKGRPVRGLEAPDFRVTVDGEPREVSSVDRGTGSYASVSRARSVEGGGSRRAGTLGDRGRWITVVLDADRVPLTYREATLRAAARLIEQHEREDSRFSVILLKDGRADLLQPFSRAADVRPGLFDDPGLLLGTSTELGIRASDLVERLSDCPTDAVRLDTCVRRAADEFLHTTRRDNARGLEALRGIVASLAPLPGRKALVWLSGGFVLRPSDVVLEAAQAVSRQGFERLYNRLQDPPADDFDALLDEATRSRVSLFALRTGRDLASSFVAADRSRGDSGNLRAGFNPYRTASFLSEQSLRIAAESTGGRVVLTPLTDRATADLFATLDGVYTLGIRAADGDGLASRVKVRGASENLRIRFVGRLRRPAPPPRQLRGGLTVTRDGSGSMARIDLEAESLAARDDQGSEVRTVGLYYQVLDATSARLADGYRIVEFRGETERGESVVHRFSIATPPGAALVEVSVADLVAAGRGTFSTAIGQAHRAGAGD